MRSLIRPLAGLALLSASGCVVVQEPPTQAPSVVRKELPTIPPAAGAGSPGTGVAPGAASPTDAWAAQKLPAGGALRAVWAVDAQNAFAVGDAGLVVKTEDGGETWAVISQDAITDDLLAVQFIDPKTGWALAKKALYRTEDGAATWAKTPLFEGVNENEENQRYHVFGDQPRMHFRSYTHGVLTNWGRVYATSDGGATWSIEPIGTFGQLEPPTRLVVGEIFTIGDEVALTTAHGLATKQEAGWARYAAFEGNVDSVSFPTAEDGFIVSKGRLHVTGDGGQSWTQRPFTSRQLEKFVFPTSYALTSGAFPPNAQVRMTDPSSGWAFGLGGVARTTDGGRTWQWAKFPGGVVRDRRQVHLAGARTGYAVDRDSLARLLP